MKLSANAVPMRWPSGPLEIARRKALAAPERETLERWHQPATLAVLDGTPVDCLLVSWAAGLAEDQAQQRTLAPLIAAASARGVAVVGLVEADADRRAALAAAQQAGLDAVAGSGFPNDAGLPVIPVGEHESMAWESRAPVLAASGNVWPGVSRPAASGEASAGPTSLPWLDSNGWFVQLARARTATPLWLLFDPPAKPTVVPPASYSLAVCDSESAGARWVISLDDEFRAGLAAGQDKHRKLWSDVGAAAAFFRGRATWRSFRPLGLVGVLSDFSGSHFDMAGEALNLMSRRDLLFRPIWKSQLSGDSLAGLKVLVYPDEGKPEAALRRQLLSFAEQGGVLIAGPQWSAEGKPLGGDAHPRFALHGLGRGRLAVMHEPISDPFLLAGDTQMLLSHAHDLVKMFNGASSGCTNYTSSPDSKTALLQTVSYASARQPGRTTVWLSRKYAAARLWTLGAASPKAVDFRAAEDYEGWECHLGVTSADHYLALELDV